MQEKTITIIIDEQGSSTLDLEGFGVVLPNNTGNFSGKKSVAFSTSLSLGGSIRLSQAVCRGAQVGVRF